MTCPSVLLHSMFVDGALTGAEHVEHERHVHSCTACAARVAALRREIGALREALRETDPATPIPAFQKPLGEAQQAGLAIAALMAAGVAGAFWNAFRAAIPAGFAWLNPFDGGELFERAADVVAFIIYEGSTVWTNSLNVVGGVLLLTMLLWGAHWLARGRGGHAMLLSVLIMVVAALPSLGHAFEIRQGELTTVGAEETINDSLLAAGQTIAIDGDVNGDLLAFGSSVTVRGNVKGDLVTAAETVTIEGTIGGNILAFGRGVSLNDTRVAGNVYGFGRDIDVNADSDIGGNSVAVGDNVNVNGRIGIDLKSFARTLAVSGNVQGDVDAFAEKLTLLPSARVGGNIVARVENPQDLQIAPGAIVGGSIDRRIEEGEETRSPYLTASFYLQQVVRLGAAFVTGLLLLWIFPPLRTLELPNVAAVLRAGGIGFVAAVALPVAALVLCITIIGLPLGLAAFLLGAIGLYFAKALLAQLVGRRLFRSPAGPPHYAATLFAGLVAIIIVINLPFIGGVANFVLTLVGFGMLVSHLFVRFGRSERLA